jgi:hypothetical protein
LAWSRTGPFALGELWSTPHLRLLRDHDRFFDAFEIAHGHICMRILELEILRAFDRASCLL